MNIHHQDNNNQYIYKRNQLHQKAHKNHEQNLGVSKTVFYFYHQVLSIQLYQMLVSQILCQLRHQKLSHSDILQAFIEDFLTDSEGLLIRFFWSVIDCLEQNLIQYLND